MDGVRKANSGHPGGAMSSSDFAYVLFTQFLNIDPDNTEWENRDRFVLSAGHESMLMYSLLFMNGWMNLDDLKSFRQLHSKTPGHPEVEIPGVECTTGPLGQGIGMGVGMAVAEAIL
ncbi:MAG TPA: transketolase, partial [Candidatus Marinimicrobia bacterium]|nr:transketolase [Candidatus Neomarinimicrobiota bacterium]